MVIRLYATLRPLAGGKHVDLPAEPGETVNTILGRLLDLHPRLEGEILTPDRQSILPYVQVFVAGRSVRDLQGLATVLENPTDMAIFPPVAGG
ncbi:MAG TPA: ubiquitin-like small modifier protein 1 [Symbiobacteriaceae bacterium]|nr:ubiquitin-like small modifier protein 1 [Symbiobacteriaceae bacterium]